MSFYHLLLIQHWIQSLTQTRHQAVFIGLTYNGLSHSPLPFRAQGHHSDHLDNTRTQRKISPICRSSGTHFSTSQTGLPWVFSLSHGSVRSQVCIMLVFSAWLENYPVSAIIPWLWFPYLFHALEQGWSLQHYSYEFKWYHLNKIQALFSLELLANVFLDTNTCMCATVHRLYGV